VPMITLYAAEEPDCAFFVDVAQSQVMDRWEEVHSMQRQSQRGGKLVARPSP
jgi:hypothetical protein